MNSIIIDDLLVEKETVNEDYLCIICNNIAQDTLQCREGHLACRDCFTKMIELKKECMTCRCEIKSIESLSKNRYLEKEIRKLKIYCPFSFTSERNTEDGNLIIDTENGCKQQITIDSLDSHLKNCEFKFIKCTNLYDPGNSIDNGVMLDFCDIEFRQNQYSKHQEICEYSIITCDKCNNDYSRKDIIKHNERDCPNIEVSCNNCKMESILKCELLSHLDNDCPDVEINCPLSQGGCIDKIKRNQLSEHLKDSQHFQFVQNQLKIQQIKIDQLTNELQELKNGNYKSSLDNDNNRYYSGTWVIKKWSEKLKQYPPKKYITLKFNLSPTKPFSIRIYPNGSSIMWSNVTLSLVKEFEAESLIKFSFELENVDKSKSDEQKRTDIFKPINDSWSLQFYKICEDKESSFTQNDQITINFTVKIKKTFENSFITE